jgi:hypothetical protein
VTKLGPPPVTPGAASLIDCDVCAGVGIMTARSVDATFGPAREIVPCVRCGGSGVFLRRTDDVITDIAAWVERTVTPPAVPPGQHPEAAGFRRLAALARLQARLCVRSAVAASTSKDVQEQAELGRAYLRAAGKLDRAALSVELARGDR